MNIFEFVITATWAIVAISILIYLGRELKSMTEEEKDRAAGSEAMFIMAMMWPFLALFAGLWMLWWVVFDSWRYLRRKAG